MVKVHTPCVSAMTMAMMTVIMPPVIGSRPVVIRSHWHHVIIEALSRHWIMGMVHDLSMVHRRWDRRRDVDSILGVVVRHDRLQTVGGADDVLDIPLPGKLYSIFRG